jgi:hypothetical protein
MILSTIYTLSSCDFDYGQPIGRTRQFAASSRGSSIGRNSEAARILSVPAETMVPTIVRNSEKHMTNGAVNRQLQGRIDATAWVRFLVEQHDDRWTLRYGHAVIGDQPGSWPGDSWTYEQLRFLAAELPVHDLLGALDGAPETRLIIDGVEVTVPTSNETNVQHRPSFELHDRERLPHPSFEYSLSRVGGRTTTNQRSGFLVGPDSPSFTDLDAAYRAFFLGSYEVPANQSIPSELLHVRVVDQRAWIGPIHVRATELTVQVGDTARTGLTLEYFSPTYRTRVAVEQAGELFVPLPDGVGSTNTWVWLTEGTDWRDYRALTGPWASDEQLTDADVEREFASRDMQAEVEAIVYGGEGPEVEFKGQLPESAAKTASMFKTVAAFANGSGGTIVLGVSRDELTVVGIGEDVDPNKERDRVGQLIRTRVLPTPIFGITHHVVDGKSLLFVEVQPSPSPPYGVIMHLNERDTPQYFVRRGASTYPAQPSDLNEIVQRMAAAVREAGAIPFGRR